MTKITPEKYSGLIYIILADIIDPIDIANMYFLTSLRLLASTTLSMKISDSLTASGPISPLFPSLLPNPCLSNPKTLYPAFANYWNIPP